MWRNGPAPAGTFSDLAVARQAFIPSRVIADSTYDAVFLLKIPAPNNDEERRYNKYSKRVLCHHVFLTLHQLDTTPAT